MKSKSESKKADTSRYLPLRINTFTDRLKNGVDFHSDTITTLTTEYFECKLQSIDNGKFYIGGGVLKPMENPDEYEYVHFSLIDLNNKPCRFNTPRDLLNFLSERGYEYLSKQEEKYQTVYTFKKNRSEIYL